MLRELDQHRWPVTTFGVVTGRLGGTWLSPVLASFLFS
jgi:hypothetical protein